MFSRALLICQLLVVLTQGQRLSFGVATTDSGGSEGGPEGRAPARHSVEVCQCQCVTLGFVGNDGSNNGNCRT